MKEHNMIHVLWPSHPPDVNLWEMLELCVSTAIIETPNKGMCFGRKSLVEAGQGAWKLFTKTLVVGFYFKFSSISRIVCVN